MADIEWLQRAVARDPGRDVVLDLEAEEVRFGGRTLRARMPDGPRRQLTSGTWNAMGVLLEAGEAIEHTAGRLPYVTGF
jgi:3-isopropylmalate/(R)-2-methylmalate dehydratase small subunit